MRVNLQLNTNSYKNSNLLYAVNKKINDFQGTADVNNGHISLKRMLTEAKQEEKKPVYLNNNNILASSMSYSEKLKAQRENMKNASLEKKKLKYQFKDISSQIIRSKTSQTARQAVSSARRELLRLKQEKQSGKYDPEEVEAAINHAKAMERVARKKVRHLEEEELAKASGGPCSDVVVEQEERLEEERAYEKEIAEAENEETLAEDIDYEDVIEEIDFSDDIEMMMDDMEELTEETLDEMSESMQDMLEEMGLGELTDSLMAAKGDMDPEDLKMLKIKHRCKEMKEMVKADADYLKAVFEQLEKQKGSGSLGIPLGNSGGLSISSDTVMPQINIQVDAPMSTSIDVSV